MRFCARCRKEIGDNETYCSRCGSTQFIDGQRPQQQTQQPGGQMQGRPMQGQMQSNRPMMNNGQMQGRPAAQFNGQQPMGARPMQNQPQGQYQNQMQGRPMQNNNQMYQQQMQQNHQQIQYNGQQPQGNYGGYQQQQPANNGGYNQQPVNNGGYTSADFVDTPEQTEKPKKKLFSGKSKKEKMYEEMKQMGQQAQTNHSVSDPTDAKTAQFNNMQEQTNNIVKQAAIQTGTGIITVFDWILTMILMMIPIVNIVYIVKTLLNKTVNPSKKNYVKAYLVWYVISLLIVIILILTGAVKFLI